MTDGQSEATKTMVNETQSLHMATDPFAHTVAGPELAHKAARRGDGAETHVDQKQLLLGLALDAATWARQSRQDRSFKKGRNN